MNPNIVVKRYILLHIYLEKLKPGDKIWSAKQLSIRFGVSVQTIKKILQLFLDNNILITKKRIGYFINSEIYKILPLSLRYKYGVEPLVFSFKNKDDYFSMRKEYSIKSNKREIWVETSMENNIFKHTPYKKQKTFMWNLSYAGIVIFKFHSDFKFEKIDNKEYIIENRNLYNEEQLLIAKEKIYIPAEIWVENKVNII